MRKHLLRLGIRVFGVVAPRRAAAWLEGQLTIPRPAPDLNLAMPGVTGVVQRVPFGEGNLAAMAWGGGPTVLLLHGWGGRSRSLWSFVPPLVERRFRVVAFDFPAHGRSDGVHTSMPECADAVLAVAAAMGPVEAVIAHSFGGPTAALAWQRGFRCARLALLAPPRSVRALTREAAREIGASDAVLDVLEERFSAHRGVDWKTLDTDRLVRDIGAPVLVVHDAADRITPASDGAAIANAAPQGRMLSTAGLGHRGVLADETVVREVVGFVTGE